MVRATLVAAGLALLLAACGFQLRGQARLPAFMNQTWLAVADDSTVFVRELRLLLEANGATLVDGPGADVATLRIDAQRIWRQPLSVSGRAQVREYLIIFELGWALEAGAGEVELERSTIRMTRDYSFDESEILAAQREEEFLRHDLGRAVAEQLIRRLEALGGAES